MAKKGLLVIVVVLLLTIGCTSSVPESNPAPENNLRIRYLPDGRMALLQSSIEDKAVTFPDANLDMAVREKLEDMAILAEGDSHEDIEDSK